MNYISTALNSGQIITNEDLCKIFRCSSQGGMRRSLTTNSLVLVADHVDPVYHDRWVEDIFLYAGMGWIGDQSIERAQNKTLAESRINDVNVFLFEKFQKNQYKFMGEVELADRPYQESQEDASKSKRKVWIFPLRIKSGQPVPSVSIDIITENQERAAKFAHKLSNKELDARLKYVPNLPGTRNVNTKKFIPSSFVAEKVKRRAKGFCEFCGESAPFLNKDGEPFLETHHIQWMAREGKDTIENIAALCPNCHRRMHVLDNESDAKELQMMILMKNKS